MADPDLTPEALKRLIERLRSPLLPTFDDCHEAAAAISGLMAEQQRLERMELAAKMDFDRVNKRALASEDRAHSAEAERDAATTGLRSIVTANVENMRLASSAEAKLREINVLAREARTVEGISIALALQTIETLSRSTSQGGEG